MPDGDPDFARGLSCEVVEAKCGKQTDNSFRKLVRCFNESVVLTCREIRRGVKTSVHLLEKAFADKASKVVSWDAEGASIPGSNDLVFGGESKKSVRGSHRRSVR